MRALQRALLSYQSLRAECRGQVLWRTSMKRSRVLMLLATKSHESACKLRFENEGVPMSQLFRARISKRKPSFSDRFLCRVCLPAALVAAIAFANASPALAKLYVTNPCDSTVTAYPAGSNGNISPLSPVTGLANPQGVAVDASGRVYVANSCTNSLTLYAAGSNGEVKP